MMKEIRSSVINSIPHFAFDYSLFTKHGHVTYEGIGKKIFDYFAKKTPLFQKIFHVNYEGVRKFVFSLYFLKDFSELSPERT